MARSGQNKRNADRHFLSFLEGKYPGARLNVLSETNNHVVQVSLDDRTFVAKRLSDRDIPTSYTVRVAKFLSKTIPVPKIVRVFRGCGDDQFDCVLSEHIEGLDLAQILRDGGDRPTDLELTKFLIALMQACSGLPRLKPQFALYKVSGPRFSSHGAFIQFYASNYWRRVRHLIEKKRVVRWVDNWVNDYLISLSSQLAPFGYQTVAVDVNLKNLIVRPDGSLVVLNVPIVGYSNRAHAAACISVHYRNRPIRQEFLKAATANFDPQEVSAIQHFELWHLLGIMSFYAMNDEAIFMKCRNWGAPVPLIQDFYALVGTLREQSSTTQTKS